MNLVVLLDSPAFCPLVMGRKATYSRWYCYKSAKPVSQDDCMMATESSTQAGHHCGWEILRCYFKPLNNSFVVLNHHWSSVVVGYSNITKTSLIGRSHLSLCSNFISSKDLFIQNTCLLSISLCVSTWLYFSSLDLFSSRK